MAVKLSFSEKDGIKKVVYWRTRTFLGVILSLLILTLFSIGFIVRFGLDNTPIIFWVVIVILFLGSLIPARVSLIYDKNKKSLKYHAWKLIKYSGGNITNEISAPYKFSNQKEDYANSKPWVSNNITPEQAKQINKFLELPVDSAVPYRAIY